MSTKLSAATLSHLPASVATPSYKASDLTAGILHFGVGNFHRSHQAVYLDELFNSGADHDFAIVGAGVFEAEKHGRELLRAQDWLTTVVEQDTGHTAARVTAALVDFLEPGDTAAIVAKLTDPAIRIVSLTITEGGYFIDSGSGKFNPDHPDIVSDGRNPGTAKTVFGLILAGLKRRKEAGTPPFTVMCCDNIPHNGHVARDTVVGLAKLFDPAFAAWIEQNVAFPNSMVDRITPATTDRERSTLEEEFGVEDAWPVFCEPFRQWVLEDHFPAGRPALEKVGVQFVEDVAPFELMKIRILNGGHAAIAYPAALLGIHFVHEAMQEPLIRGFLAKLTRDEIIPTVPSVLGTNLEDYYQLVERRFSNPKIGDTIQRLSFDGSNRQPKFIVPVIADRIRAHGDLSGLALVSALWCRYCYSTNDAGDVTALNDPMWERLSQTAKAAKDHPPAWLAMTDIYGDTGKSPVFMSAFTEQLNSIWQEGTRPTLLQFLNLVPVAAL